MGTWLRENGLDAVNAQERYAILKILENLDAVTSWRDSLPEAQRRKHNHPSLWHVFRRATKAETAAPTHRHVVKGAKAKGNGHAIHWNADAIRRAASAIRRVYSTDFYVMARRALEAAVRNEADLIELLPPDTVAMSALPLAEKAARTVGILSERLDQHRGRGQQQITVKYVTKQTEDTAAPVSHQFHAKEIAAARDR
jgi:hypothetical protein